MDWLIDGLRYVDSWIGFQMRASEQPGCSIAIEHAGELAYERAFGISSLATGNILTPRHRFRVASHSKAFTSAAIMLLREQGRIKLDESVSVFVSDLPTG